MGESILTAGFARHAGEMRCEGVSLQKVAESAGTPAYVYSAGAIREQYERLHGAFASVDHRLHYSVKANSSLAILAELRKLGAGLDIVSGGELFRALKAGFHGSDIVFSGVGKDVHEMEDALNATVLLINVESEEELIQLNDVAGRMKKRAPIALRVNPEVMVDTPHPYTRTGEKGMKFGIPFDETLRVAKAAIALPHIDLIGLDMHVGSQISRFEPYETGMSRLLSLLTEVLNAGAKIRYLDIGGGLAVTYEAEDAMDVDAFAVAIKNLLPQDMKLILEPGRFLVGNAGVLLTRVLFRKRSGGKEFIITDAGMNDLLRPSHYNAFHRIELVVPNGRETVANVVGPVCESGDFFALDRKMDDAMPGDLLAVQSAGAYGFVMASNYNSRRKPAEVLVDGDAYAVITEREDYSDLIRKETLEPQWRTD